MDALCSRMEHQKAHKGMGEISLFGGVAIGHKTLKGVQWVYAWPFPKRLFRGNCNRQDFVFVQPLGSDHALFHPSPDNVWNCRCLLFFTIVVRTDVMGSVSIKCALLSKLEQYGAPDPEPDDWMRKAETCRLYQLAPTPRLSLCQCASHHSHIGQGAHGPCWKHRLYSVQHARARARILSRRKV